MYYSAHFATFLFLLFSSPILIYSQKLAEQKIESYESCRDDSDCKENSFCFGNDDALRGKCKCKDGFELSRNRTFYECLRAVKLGDACERDFQCQILAGPLAVCNRFQICQCNELAHNYTDGLCYKSVKLNEFCLSDPNCKLDNNEFGFCTAGKCECRANERPSDTLTLCLVSRNLGEICKSDEECQGIPNTVCQEGCRCAAGYSVSRDGQNCLKAALKFGDPCVEDAQCSNYLVESICSNNNCTCFPGFHGYDNKCLKTSRAGETCRQDADCVFDEHLKGKVKCTNLSCHCVLGKSDNIYGCELGAAAVTFSSKILISISISYLVIFAGYQINL